MVSATDFLRGDSVAVYAVEYTGEGSTVFNAKDALSNTELLVAQK